MAWTSPVQPISGTVITVAWATSTIVDNLNWLRALTGGADPPAANRIIRSTSTSATTWDQVTTDCIANSAVTNDKIAGDTITESKLVNGTIIESKLNSAVTAKLVPSGLIAAFRTAGAIASGWSRFTDGDGRILIGAGTTFSQTFTENQAAGTGNWTPISGGSTSGPSETFPVAGGSTQVASGAHTHTISATTWIPPVRVVVHAIKS